VLSAQLSMAADRYLELNWSPIAVLGPGLWSVGAISRRLASNAFQFPVIQGRETK